MAIIVLMIVVLCSIRVYAQLTQVQIANFTSRNVSITDYNATHLLFQHNGIPDHEYGQFPNEHNPNNVSEQRHMFYIRKTPLAIDSPMCLPLGPIAIAINGIPLYNPYSGEGFNAVEGECKEIFDVCNGHPSPDGVYHYHQIPNCLYSQAPDQLIGVAIDGHPIYGPLTKDGKNLTSTDLDVCHGRFINGQYEYRMTYDFPYILSCFHSFGLVQVGGKGSMGSGMQQPPMGGMPPPNGGMPPPNGGMPPSNGGMPQQPLNRTCIRKENWEALVCYADCKDPSLGCDNKNTTSSGKVLLTGGISRTCGISPNNIVLAAMMCVIIYYANLLP
ncbi:hypothetical protein CHS0354_004279 [Potamilus streckersoni]|uniref:YHYH domain-containing protein n=1 Tax=Potamilus streckersoni TaxID=2493646 RepID=A0AAE0VQB4_9BIVA|nr:hypothetical protein CHS0354_004279 [Potamilus streckersoni]